MAIKIDLLPGYVRLEKVRNRVLLASGVAIVVVASGLLLELERKNLELQTAKNNRDTFKTVADQSTAAKAEADKFIQDRAAIDGTVAWLVSASKTGPERAALLNLISQYIYGNTLVTTIDVSDGQTVKLGGRLRDPNEYARFLLNLRRASDQQGGPLFAGLPTASGVPGFPSPTFVDPQPNPSGQPVQLIYPLTLNAEGKLKTPVSVPSDPIAGDTAAAAAPGAPPQEGTP